MIEIFHTSGKAPLVEGTEAIQHYCLALIDSLISILTDMLFSCVGGEVMFCLVTLFMFSNSVTLETHSFAE